MDIFFFSWSTNLSLIIVGIFMYMCHILNDLIEYFNRRQFPTTPIATAWHLNKDLFSVKISFTDYVHEFYKSLDGHQIGGIYQLFTPCYMVRDSELADRILTRDFSHFHDRKIVTDTGKDPLENHLFNMKGGEWMTLRKKLTPIFTSGKIKWMFSQLDSSADSLMEVLRETVKSPKQDVLIRNILSRFSIDVISNCAFGVDSGAMKNPECDFTRMAKKMFFRDEVRGLKLLWARMVRGIGRIFKMKIFDQEIDDFFIAITKQAFDHRIRTNEVRNDFVQLLLELRGQGFAVDSGQNVQDGKPKSLVFTDELLAAQSFIFLVADWENSTGATSFALYHLGKNKNIQEQVRNEIRNIKRKYKGKITYDGLKEMTLLDMCISETLRLNPPVGAILRVCTKDYTLEDGRTIEKGEKILIPSYSMQVDPVYHRDPLLFKPERFITSTNKMTSTYLPFGNGPRACIGIRFALLQIKLSLARILDEFDVTVSPKVLEPIARKPGRFEVDIVGGLWLMLDKI